MSQPRRIWDVSTIQPTDFPRDTSYSAQGPGVLLMNHTATECLQLLSQRTFLTETHPREIGLKRRSTEEEAEEERGWGTSHPESQNQVLMHP